jgi:hypothetical protein
MIEQKVKV